MLYRPVRESEVPEAAQVFLTTLGDLAKRNGLPQPTGYTLETVKPVYTHLARTGIFWVAEDAGRIVAICIAIVRERRWFLSMFWVLPEFQKQRVGKPLLERVFSEGYSRGAREFFTWSSIDFAALGTYLRLGLLPCTQMLSFAGPLDAGAWPELLDSRPSFAPLDLPAAASVDAHVLGVERGVDHSFWLSQPGVAAERLVGAGGDTLGYYYSRGGTVGPVAWTLAAHSSVLLLLLRALARASTQAESVRIAVPGLNHTGLTAALQAGLKLVSTGHLLQSAPFGMPEHYVPSGPALF